MGRSSRLKKDRRIIRNNIDDLLKEAEIEKDEKKFFEKLSVVQNFDYLVQEDKLTKNNFMHKIILEKLRTLINNKVINPGIESNKERFDKIYQDKEIPSDISLRDLSLFSIYMNEKSLEIKKRNDYQEIISYLNDKEITKKILDIKIQNKEVSELTEDEKKFIADYVLQVNKVMEIVNNEVIAIGDKIVTKSKDFKIDDKDLTLEDSIFMAHITSFNNGIFKLAIKEVEEYNKVLEILNSMLNVKKEENK